MLTIRITNKKSHHDFIHTLAFILLLFSQFILYGQISEPLFSVERGFYIEPFDLILSTSEVGMIYYTTDGSDPRSSNTAHAEFSPCTIHIDPFVLPGRDKAPCVIIRACVHVEESLFSRAVTHTYLFLNDIGLLSPDGEKPGPGWPDLDFGMDPEVLNDTRYQDQIVAALKSVPTFSMVTDLFNLFDPDSGIFSHPEMHGYAWEKPVSLELIRDDGKPGFQVDAGLRLRGGYTRDIRFPKHAFRLFFRSEYGTNKLCYPLFEDEGVNSFDKIDLRTSQNYAWSTSSDSKYNIMNRDVFSRDTQKEMGQPYNRSRYYHLYINGTYWGLYQTQERSEANFGASYLGGSEDDYDVVKTNQEISGFAYEIEATDGNLDSWDAVWRLCNEGFNSNENYFQLQGMDPGGSRNDNYPVLVDIDNLIDYQLVLFYTGNRDAPTTLSGTCPNNFYAIYNRKSDRGFTFYAHDSEHTLLYSRLSADLNRNTVIDIRAVNQFKYFQPLWLHSCLTKNAEYRLRVADRIYAHFFNGGALTPEACIQRFQERANQIGQAIIAESARWGDCYVKKPRTKDDDWLPAIQETIEKYFPARTNIVFTQLKNAGLYPQIDPPLFFSAGNFIETQVLDIDPGYSIQFNNPNHAGQIYYTLDASDPRAIGGIVAPDAILADYNSDISVWKSMTIKARVKTDDQWSALHCLTCYLNQEPGEIKITEIQYHPLGEENMDEDNFEFVELKNIGQNSVNLRGYHFLDGIEFSISQSANLDPGEFFVIASNAQAFQQRYGLMPDGEYRSQLSNSGESLVLADAYNKIIFSVTYRDQAPWPVLADGLGKSLVLKRPDQQDNPDNPLSWRHSYTAYGSPFADDEESTKIFRPGDPVPTTNQLYQNYPNPFNTSTEIKFSLNQAAIVTITIYNIHGQEIIRLKDGVVMSQGEHRILWNASSSASGIYIYKISTEKWNLSKRMLLLK